MKYIGQILLIIVISFLGEILHEIIPLPCPASIYGMAILFFGLLSGIIKRESVEETGTFLLDVMPIMFIPAGVGLLTTWGALRSVLLPISIITVLGTVIVMAVSGRVTQAVIRQNRKKESS